MDRGGPDTMTVQTIDALPDEVNIAAYAGDTFAVTVRFTTYSVPADAAYRAHIKVAPDGSAPDEEFGVEVLTDGCRLTLTAEQTEALSGGLPASTSGPAVGVTADVPQYVGVWDLEFSSVTDAVTRTLVRGDFSLLADVTDAPAVP